MAVVYLEELNRVKLFVIAFPVSQRARDYENNLRGLKGGRFGRDEITAHDT